MKWCGSPPTPPHPPVMSMCELKLIHCPWCHLTPLASPPPSMGTAGAVITHLTTYLWECFRNALLIHSSCTPVETSINIRFSERHTRQVDFKASSRPFWCFLLGIFFPVCKCSTLFFKPFELMLLLCLTLGLLRGAMLSTWPLELVTL